MEPSLHALVLLLVGLGLLGFVAPCSMGANLPFLRLVVDRSPSALSRARIAQSERQVGLGHAPARAVAIPPAGRMLSGFTALPARLPMWTGLVLAVLGLWSIWFGLFVNPEDWT